VARSGGSALRKHETKGVVAAWASNSGVLALLRCDDAGVRWCLRRPMRVIEFQMGRPALVRYGLARCGLTLCRSDDFFVLGRVDTVVRTS
jgi:hypothetical protein